VVVPEKGKINIFGEVVSPGQYSIDGEVSILEALAFAGTSRNSSLRGLKIVRSTGERFEVDARKIWEGPCPEAEIRLTTGDTLIVPSVFKIDWNLVNTAILILSWVYTIIKG
jgi:protein involved in polysaccharide export with SLBB domain